MSAQANASETTEQKPKIDFSSLQTAGDFLNAAHQNFTAFVEFGQSYNSRGNEAKVLADSHKTDAFMMGVYMQAAFLLHEEEKANGSHTAKAKSFPDFFSNLLGIEKGKNTFNHASSCRNAQRLALHHEETSDARWPSMGTLRDNSIGSCIKASSILTKIESGLKDGESLFEHPAILDLSATLMGALENSKKAAAITSISDRITVDKEKKVIDYIDEVEHQAVLDAQKETAELVDALNMGEISAEQASSVVGMVDTTENGKGAIHAILVADAGNASKRETVLEILTLAKSIVDAVKANKAFAGDTILFADAGFTTKKTEKKTAEKAAA